LARSHARIFTSIWDDPDFLARSSLAQRFYMMLLSQPNLGHAGILPTTVRRWTLLSADEDEDALRGAMAEMTEHRFVVVDERTEELLIRSLIRNDGVWKQPKVLAVAIAEAASIRSPSLRSCVADELARLDEVSSLPDKTRPEVEALLKDLPHRLANAHLELGAQGGTHPPADPPPDPPADQGGEEGSDVLRARARAAPTPATVPIPSPVPPPAGAAKTPRAGKAKGTGDAQESLPGAPPASETPDQRANRLAVIYTDRMPLAKFQAAREIVRRAIDAKLTDEAISAALTSLADRNKTLTLNSLHEAVYGPNGRKPGGPRGGASDDLSGEVYGKGSTRI
jgi:hypothetical protein